MGMGGQGKRLDGAHGDERAAAAPASLLEQLLLLLPLEALRVATVLHACSTEQSWQCLATSPACTHHYPPASLTKGHHAAEAADVGVELLDALDQLVAGINVNPRILVAQTLCTAHVLLLAAPPPLLPRRRPDPSHRCCCRRHWPAPAAAAGTHAAAAAAPAAVGAAGLRLNGGRQAVQHRPHAYAWCAERDVSGALLSGLGRWRSPSLVPKVLSLSGMHTRNQRGEVHGLDVEGAWRRAMAHRPSAGGAFSKSVPQHYRRRTVNLAAGSPRLAAPTRGPELRPRFRCTW